VSIKVAKKVRFFLERKGFNVLSPGFLKGSSGVEHNFDIVAVKRNRMLCIDIQKNDPYMDCLSAYLKAIDISEKKVIFVCRKEVQNLIPRDLLDHLDLILYSDTENLLEKLNEKIR